MLIFCCFILTARPSSKPSANHQVQTKKGSRGFYIQQVGKPWYTLSMSRSNISQQKPVRSSQKIVIQIGTKSRRSELEFMSEAS